MIRVFLPLDIPRDVEARDYATGAPLTIEPDSYPVEVHAPIGTVIGVAHGGTMSRFLTLPDGTAERLD